ncbi:MAG TPA: hypothetical protein VFQ61_22220 [Polyangiaceae bacterium]|nr:hypothetical protein [Polyangiaceae bacterium]
MEHSGRWLLGLGLLGMLGFVGSCLGLLLHPLPGDAYLVCISCFLAFYLTSLFVGYIGESCPREPRTRTPPALVQFSSGRHEPDEPLELNSAGPWRWRAKQRPSLWVVSR